jgi:hypothetical protein
LAARSTTPGQRAKRRACSAPERRWAPGPPGGEQLCMMLVGPLRLGVTQFGLVARLRGPTADLAAFRPRGPVLPPTSCGQSPQAEPHPATARVSQGRCGGAVGPWSLHEALGKGWNDEVWHASRPGREVPYAPPDDDSLANWRPSPPRTTPPGRRCRPRLPSAPIQSRRPAVPTVDREGLLPSPIWGPGRAP